MTPPSDPRATPVPEGVRALELPADPAMLATYLEQHNSCDVNPRNPVLSAAEAAFSEIAMIIDALQVLPPRHGAILFRAAAKIPGTKVLAHLTDAAGLATSSFSDVSVRYAIASTPRRCRSASQWPRLDAGHSDGLTAGP